MMASLCSSDVHIGAYYMFSAATHRLITIPLAKYLDARLFGKLCHHTL